LATAALERASPPQQTLERVAGLDVDWGGSIHMSLGFRDQGWLLSSVRSLVVSMCGVYLDSGDVSQQLVNAVQELLENLVKYSESDCSALQFELLLVDGQPTARLGTENDASALHLEEAQRLLDRIISAPDPLELYQALIATSGEHSGSGLGLARLRAEAGMTLSYGIHGGRLRLDACRPVLPRGDS
jgi:hypothetical protein